MEKIARILMIGAIIFALMPAATADKVIDLRGQEPGTVVTSADETADQIMDRIRVEESIKAQRDRYLVEHLVKSGKARFYDLEHELAKTEFERALAIDPNHIEAREYLRKSNLILGVKEGRFEGMIDAVRQQETVHRELILAHLRLAVDKGRNEFNAEEYEKAISTLRRARELARHVSPYYDVSATQTTIEDLLRRSEVSLERQRAEREARQRREAEAVARIRQRELLEREATRISRLLSNGREFLRQGRYKEARRLAESILKLDPGNREAMALREVAFNSDLRTLRAKTSDSNRKETLLAWAASREAQVPYSDVLVYPENWAEIVKRQVTDIGSEPEEVPAWMPDLERRLKSPITFDFHSTPLEDVVRFLGAMTDIHFHLSPKALDTLGDPSVTLKVVDIELEKALEWILADVGLRYALRDNRVFISTPDDVAGDTTTRFYDVTDITVEIRDFPGNLKALRDRVGTSGGEGGGGGGGWDVDIWQPQAGDDETIMTPRGLMDLIRRTIAPGSWEPD